MDTLQFSDSPGEYLLDKGMYHCFKCIPQVDVKADGDPTHSGGEVNLRAREIETTLMALIASNSIRCS
jgi:hypothetical protein